MTDACGMWFNWNKTNEIKERVDVVVGRFPLLHVNNSNAKSLLHCIVVER